MRRFLILTLALLLAGELLALTAAVQEPRTATPRQPTPAEQPARPPAP